MAGNRDKNKPEDGFELSDEFRSVDDAVSSLPTSGKSADEVVNEALFDTVDELERFLDQDNDLPPDQAGKEQDTQHQERNENAIAAPPKDHQDSRAQDPEEERPAPDESGLDPDKAREMARERLQQASRQTAQAEIQTAEQSAVSYNPGAGVSGTFSSLEAVVLDSSVFLSPASVSGRFPLQADQYQGLAAVPGGINGHELSESIPIDPQLESRQRAHDQARREAAASAHLAATKTASNRQQAIRYAVEKRIQQLFLLTRRISGADLPARRVPLEFSFPQQKSKRAFNGVVSTHNIKKYFNSKSANALNLFKKAEQDLAVVIKCKLSAAHRLALLDCYVTELQPRLLQLIQAFEKRPSALQDDKRLQSSELAANALKHLIVGYKQVFSADYQSANFFYLLNRRRVRKCLRMLVELLCLEQLLNTAMQHEISTASIKSMNTIFSCIQLYEPDILEQIEPSIAIEDACTLTQLYAWFQLLSVIDSCKLSASQHRSLKRYIRQHLALFSYRKTENDSVLTEQSWCIAYNDQHPPRLLAPKIQQQLDAFAQCCRQELPQVVLGVQRFFNQVKEDHRSCLALVEAGNNRHALAGMDNLSPRHALAIIGSLHAEIQRNEWALNNPRYSTFRALGLRVYSDLEDCVSICNYRYHKKIQDQTKRNAGDKVSISHSPPKNSCSDWLSAGEDEDHLYLQTSEPAADLLLDVGLLALCLKADDAGAESLLCQIVRVQRLPNERINIDMDILAREVSNVMIITTEERQIPALIAKNGNSHFLCCNHKVQFNSADTLTIVFPDEQQAEVQIQACYALSHYSQILKLS